MTISASAGTVSAICKCLIYVQLFATAKAAELCEKLKDTPPRMLISTFTFRCTKVQQEQCGRICRNYQNSHA